MAIEGQLFDEGKENEIVEGMSTLELPAVMKREVENYFERVDQWTKFRTGKSINDPNLKISSSLAANIFV